MSIKNNVPVVHTESGVSMESESKSNILLKPLTINLSFFNWIPLWGFISAAFVLLGIYRFIEWVRNDSGEVHYTNPMSALVFALMFGIIALGIGKTEKIIRINTVLGFVGIAFSFTWVAILIFIYSAH